MRVIVGCLLALMPLCAQDKQDKAKKEMPAPTNLKMLKAATGAEVRQIMRTFTSGLGVQCNYCHVQGNFASDDNPKKAIARHMIEITQRVNGQFADGKMHVTCYTCHRGEAIPKTEAAAPGAEGGRGRGRGRGPE